MRRGQWRSRTISRLAQNPESGDSSTAPLASPAALPVACARISPENWMPATPSTLPDAELNALLATSRQVLSSAMFASPDGIGLLASRAGGLGALNLRACQRR